MDDSFSMTTRVVGEFSRWDLACDTLQILAELASDYDDDGVDVFFLNSKHALKVQVLNCDVAFVSFMPGLERAERSLHHAGCL